LFLTLNRLYADRPNWPAQAQQQMAPYSNPKVWKFMGRVLGADRTDHRFAAHEKVGRRFRVPTLD
jgi:hypothetical protein